MQDTQLLPAGHSACAVALTRTKPWVQVLHVACPAASWYVVELHSPQDVSTWFIADCAVPGEQEAHARFDVRVGRTDTNVPAAHRLSGEHTDEFWN